MINTPFSSWPDFRKEEVDSVAKVLLSNKVNYWTGNEGREFEKEFARYCNTTYAVAVANGTVALDISLKALGIGHGDEVVVTPRTFIASVSAIVNAGATPIFAEVDRETQNITACSIASVLTNKSRAIICVHFAGMSCDMDPIMALATKHHLCVIEDCAQAHGAKYKGRSVGSIGHIGAWSFCQDKIISTGGEGGIITTNSLKFWEYMWSYKDHGKSYQAVYHREHPAGFRWLHESFGTNWRMTEMQSAIGRIQLEKLPEWTRLRQYNAAAIRSVCEDIAALRVSERPADIEHACYKYYVFVRPECLKTGWSREAIIEEVVNRGVPCYSGSCAEVYLEKAFDNTGLRPAVRLPVARELGETSLMFLVHPTLTEAEIKKTCDVLTAVMHEASQR
ncbi:MAG: DegT/DnrJ/EryC1/StrS aminotransferase family protein [Candidatus Endonucleobacter bathymodioli]|uniref:DegT/DnrJ/EryC1/StrS aminotransferase family protein n=1 Tax=Candidatus Endonucleibacter bathymodioli TaxID=539814 RepID=A0AA90NN56_9GAMM|nr:DegT/DnrJ/EryC1/StrS aminotransferase family protein [Candidatus Endonucleobacter bathymodioli]